MKYDWIDEFLLGKKGVRKDFKEEWNWLRYMIGDSRQKFCSKRRKGNGGYER